MSDRLSRTPSDARYVRRPAATRVAGETRFVAVPGWESVVTRLGGAARIVWELLEADHSAHELADIVAVDPNDPLLAEALELLTSAGLVCQAPSTDD